MAEELTIAEQPLLAPDAEVERFAERLYGYLWVRFKLVRAEERQVQPLQENLIFTEAMGKAVLCEQLLMRRVVLREIFFSWSLIIVRDPDSVYLFCQALFLNCITSWSYYKRFFRCCAVISEFYLFRRNLTDDYQLNRAERIFKVVFDDFFRSNWSAWGGWKGLDKFARERINPVYPKFETYLNYIRDPLDSNPPFIESFPISYEVDLRFVNHQARTYDIPSELAEAFKCLCSIFYSRESEETTNLFKNITLNDKPTPFENVGEGSSTSQGKDEVARPSEMVLDAPTEDKSTDSSPTCKRKPQKSPEDSPLKKIKDCKSAEDSQSLEKPSEGSMEMDLSVANTAPTEEPSQNPTTRKRAMSTDSSDENEGSKKSKNE